MNTTTGASSPTGQNMRRKTPVIGLAVHLVRGIQRVATDAVVGRVRSMPRAAADLDAASLSQIMRRTVTSVAVIGGDAGTSARARLALTGPDVPPTVFVKMPAETAATRLMGELSRLGDTEACRRRHRDGRPQTGCRCARGPRDRGDAQEGPVKLVTIYDLQDNHNFVRS
jgi:hypothetical protein